MILLLIFIALNILICYMYAENKVFPILFMLGGIMYAMSIITENELYIVLLLTFIVLYNVFIIINQNNKSKRD